MPVSDNKASSSSATSSSSGTITSDLNSKGGSDPSTNLDGDALFRRLSPSSHRALNHADGISRALQQSEIHMEHLIAGLLEKEDGPTKELLGKKKIDATTFPKVVETVLPEAYTPSVLTTLPRLSEHVRRALIAARDVAGLQESDPIRSRHLLYGALLIEDCHVIQALLKQGIRKEEINLAKLDGAAKSSARLAIPGFYSDDPDGADLLGITKEVDALCSVLAANSVEPPLSLGLFGDWGSGKSFFMRMMEKRIEKLKEASQKEASLHPERETAYCTNIVQLKFNAWYYIDTDNLWSSLASAIFAGLARALVKEDDTDPEYKSECVLADTLKSKEELARAEREKEKADVKLRESEESLRKSGQDAAAIEANLTRQALVQATLNVAIQQPEVRKTVEEAKKELNARLEAAAQELKYPSTRAVESEVKTQLQDLNGIGGSIRALAIAKRNTKGNWTWQLLTAAVVIMLIVLLLVAYGASLVGLLGSVIVLLVGMIVPVAPFIPGIWRAVSIIKQVQEERMRLINEAQKRSQVALLRDVANAREQLEKAQGFVQKASAKVIENEQMIETLRTDRQMSDFIKQRQASTVYTKHLGVIAQAREDFEKLSILLAKEKEDAEEKKKGTPENQEERLLPRIDRIILYIDDLDRCPENKVVEVLQAVHLLLAFPLFVVVVGVDSRWLLHSLKQHSRAFQSEANERDGIPDEEHVYWQSTPLNYLEKIFQIPFTLRPMKVSGFDRLIDTLATQQSKPAARTMPITAVIEGSREQNQENGAASKTEEFALQSKDELSDAHVTSPEQDKHGSASTVEPGIPGVNDPSHEDFDLNPGHLKIEEWERTVMKKLFRFIPSPRAAKRFVNVYRLLRASVDNHKLEAFKGDKNGGQHRAMLLLLAILIGYPAEATEILRDLLERKHIETWWNFMDSFKKRAEIQNTSLNGTTQNSISEAEAKRWRELMENLDVDTVRSLVPVNQSCADFVEYAPQVARYSFQSGRVLIAQRAVDTDS